MLNKNNFFILSALLIHVSAVLCMDVQNVSSIKSLPGKQRKQSVHSHSLTIQSSKTLTDIIPNIEPTLLPYDTLVGHTDLINTLKIFKTKTGKTLLASGGYDKTIKIWDLSEETFPLIADFNAQGIVWSICINETDANLYIFWSAWGENTEGYVHAKCLNIVEENGFYLKPTSDRNNLIFGPYKNTSTSMEIMPPDHIMWAGTNYIYQYTISSKELTSFKAESDDWHIFGICPLDNDFFVTQTKLSNPTNVRYSANFESLSCPEFQMTFNPSFKPVDILKYDSKHLIATDENGVNQYELTDVQGDVMVLPDKELYQGLCKELQENLAWFSNDKIMFLPHNNVGMFVTDYSTGKVLCNLVSDALTYEHSILDIAAVDDEFIIYTVMITDEKSHKFKNKIFVSRKPN